MTWPVPMAAKSKQSSGSVRVRTEAALLAAFRPPASSPVGRRG